MKRYILLVLLFLVGVGVVSGIYFQSLHQDGSVFNLQQPVDFYSCNDSRYYSGHGVEALDTASLNDYVAAVNAQGSSFCFNVADASQLGSLKLVWYSQAEAPRSIEVLGLVEGEDEASGEVLWAKEKPVTVKSLSGFFYSEINFDSPSRFSRFRVNYVSGAGQDRLLLRAAAPFFKISVDEDVASLLSDIHRVSVIAPYGIGVAETDARDVDALVSGLKSASSLHCGNYSYIFAHGIESEYDWTAVGALSNLKAAHTVVEVDYPAGKYTADPTLGALYFCSYSSMQAGTCDFSKAIYTDTYNPILWRYKGADFYPGATIQSTYSGIQDYFNAYRKLDGK
ncbi:hypothetical protein [Pseudomonas sp. EggHat1]|uniref:hypothetical protein n=1 Tax=Pseudomonas sp. EggHat1 TaxID=2761624 RepID=UPI0018696A80|nr:hypothetical protein [Pseudomonas sp. EggHat1]